MAALGVPVGRLAFVPAYAFGVAGFDGPIDAPAALRGLFGHIFVHDGSTHLFTNMLALAIFGPPLEARLGGLRFLGVFFATAVAAAVIEGLVGGDRLTPLVGASGGVSGVMGALLILNSDARLRLSLPLFGRFGRLPLAWMI
ncbi:rhomboid family intramembrane serine protease, partial [bacterium]|nr:rhomboid family intramembrane serine protease [bacterium]